MIKLKTDYAKLYTDFIDEISEKLYEEGYYPDTDVTNAEIDERFEETANAEQIVGYYIHNEGNEALIAWQRNTEGITFSEKDKEVDKILKELYSE